MNQTMTNVYKVKSNYDLTESHERLIETLKQVGFGVLWELNFKDKLREKGLEYNEDFLVMEVCNPAKAKVVLEAEIDMGFMLPCKVGIHTENGSCFIGLMKPSSMVSNESLTSLAKEVEDALILAIDGAAK